MSIVPDNECVLQEVIIGHVGVEVEWIDCQPSIVCCIELWQIEVHVFVLCVVEAKRLHSHCLLAQSANVLADHRLNVVADALRNHTVADSGQLSRWYTVEVEHEDIAADLNNSSRSIAAEAIKSVNRERVMQVAISIDT